MLKVPVRSTKEHLHTLDCYQAAFRDLVNDQVTYAKLQAGRTTAELLRLNSEDEWKFLCVAMDIVEDAASALDDFVKFGLDGPTRHDSVGERYLRLYGLLGAAYAQQQAVLRLYSLVHCPFPKEQKKNLEGQMLRLLRHQLASHSLDYMESDQRVTRAFVPVRFLLSGYVCSVAETGGDTVVTHDLLAGLDDHCAALIDLLDRIYAKCTSSLFKGQATRLSKHAKRLETLRAVRDGKLSLPFARDVTRDPDDGGPGLTPILVVFRNREES